MITDRDLIIGLYEAIGRLAHRLTGEYIGVRLVDSSTGKKHRLRTPTYHSYWINDDKGESSGDSVAVPALAVSDAAQKNAASVSDGRKAVRAKDSVPSLLRKGHPKPGRLRCEHPATKQRQR